MARDRDSQKALNKFGLILRQLREEKGWTLEETEEHGWKSWQHLQKIELGKKDITFSTLLKLSLLYRIELSDLFKGHF